MYQAGKRGNRGGWYKKCTKPASAAIGVVGTKNVPCFGRQMSTLLLFWEILIYMTALLCATVVALIIITLCLFLVRQVSLCLFFLLYISFGRQLSIEWCLEDTCPRTQIEVALLCNAPSREVYAVYLDWILVRYVFRTSITAAEVVQVKLCAVHIFWFYRARQIYRIIKV